MRDDFTSAAKKELAQQNGYKCANPNCKRATAGPDGDCGSTSIGVAAHICAASARSPRFSADMKREDRSSIENGIWLCQTCSRLVDADVPSHSVGTLNEWKKRSEIEAYLALRGLEVVRSRSFNKLVSKLPKLISEMRVDLKGSPFTREFIIMSKKWSYNGSGKSIFTYYFEDHEDLAGKMTICENYGAIVETTHNDVDRYEFTEDFAEFLESPTT